MSSDLRPELRALARAIRVLLEKGDRAHYSAPYFKRPPYSGCYANLIRFKLLLRRRL